MALHRTLSLFLLLHTLSLQAQLTDLAWVKQLGSTGVTDGSVLTLDEAGNLYVAGNFSAGSLTLGAFNLPGAVGGASFLAKYDPAGTVLWAKRMTRAGGLQNDMDPDKVAVDTAGNVYLTGYFFTGTTIDGVTLPGDLGYWLAKFNSAGVLQWTRTAACADNGIQATHTIVYIDAQQHARLVGLFKTSVAFGPGQVLANTSNPDGTDAFMATYDGDGTVVDLTGLGVVDAVSSAADYFEPEVFKVDAAGHLYRWVPEHNTLVKYAADGTQLLVKELEASADIVLRNLAVGPDESIHLIGWLTNGPVTLEGETVQSAHDPDLNALLVKLDAAGQLAWTHPYVDDYGTMFHQVRVDAIGNVVVAGRSGSGFSWLRGMVTKFSADGQWLSEGSYRPWNGVFGDPQGFVLPRNLALAPDGGNVVVMGSYKYNIIFNADVHFTIGREDYRIFLAQYGTCSTAVPTLTAPAAGFCPGEALELTASAAEEHLWSTGATTPAITATDTGLYHVFAIEHAECYARSADLHVEEFTVPEPGITAADHLLVCDLADVDYQWVDCGDGNAPIPGATAQEYAPVADGDYAVRITTADGCSALSACALYSTVGIAERSAADARITLGPNPATDMVTVHADAPVRSVEVFGVAGSRVLRTAGARFSVAALASGVYTVRVRTATGSGQARLVRE